MTTIDFRIPRELAEEAADMGLPKSPVAVDLLRDEIRRRTFSNLLENGGCTAGSLAADDAAVLLRHRKA